MYVIVAGGGKVGYYLAQHLLIEGHEVLLMERNPERVAEINDVLGAVAIVGDGAEVSALAAAGAARANVVVAVTGEDEDNLVICQVAKEKFHVGRTIARVNNPKNENLFRMLGVDVTVSQTNYILNLIEQAIPDRSFVHLLSLQNEDFAVVDAKVSEQSAVAHRALAEIELPEDTAIAAIARGPRLIVPSPATELLPGDDIIAIAHQDREDDLRRLLV
ncbi:MAG: NAD-binding protein [Thermomicrobiales bacterium]|nr:NAD-binding protein [Thermomicrobiales bacterium]